MLYINYLGFWCLQYSMPISLSPHLPFKRTLATLCIGIESYLTECQQSPNVNKAVEIAEQNCQRKKPEIRGMTAEVWDDLHSLGEQKKD